MSDERLRELVRDLPARELNAAEVERLTERVQGAWLAERAGRDRARGRLPIAMAAALVVAGLGFSILLLTWVGMGPQEETAPVQALANLPVAPDRDRVDTSAPVESGELRTAPPEGEVVLLDDDRVTLKAATVYAVRGDQANRVVQLEAGTVTCDVDKRSPEERFRVVVGDAEVEVRGTTFDVVAEQGRLLAVDVEHGRVEVRVPGQEPVVLEAGQRWDRDLVDGAAAKELEPVPPTHEIAPADAETVDSNGAGSTTGSAAKHGVDRAEAPASEAGRHLRRGMELLDKGDFGSAVDAFRKEAALGVLAEDALFWQAVAHQRAGQQTDASSTMRAFLNDYPASSRAGEVRCMLGRLLQDAGDAAAARNMFEAAAGSSSRRAAECGQAGLASLGSP